MSVVLTDKKQNKMVVLGLKSNFLYIPSNNITALLGKSFVVLSVVNTRAYSVKPDLVRNNTLLKKLKQHH